MDASFVFYEWNEVFSFLTYLEVNRAQLAGPRDVFFVSRFNLGRLWRRQ